MYRLAVGVAFYDGAAVVQQIIYCALVGAVFYASGLVLCIANPCYCQYVAIEIRARADGDPLREAGFVFVGVE